MSLFKKNLLLIIIAVIVAIAPLFLLKGADFEGADGLAQDAIAEINPEYKPWFNPLIELPSGEIESLLFCTQAAIGAGVMGFIFGRITAKPKTETKKKANQNEN